MSCLCKSSPSTLLAFYSADDRFRQTKTINPLFAVRKVISESEEDDLAQKKDDLAQKKIDYAIFLDPDSKGGAVQGPGTQSSEGISRTVDPYKYRRLVAVIHLRGQSSPSRRGGVPVDDGGSSVSKVPSISVRLQCS